MKKNYLVYILIVFISLLASTHLISAWTTSLSENIKAYFDLNEDVKATVGYDSVVRSGNRGLYNTTLNFLNISNLGKIGSGMGFYNSSNSSQTANMTIPNTIWNTTTGNMTLSFWLYLNKNNSVNDNIWYYADADTNPECIWRIADSSGNMLIQCNDGANDFSFTVASGNISTWHHWVLQVSNDSNGNATLWKDGEVVATDSTVDFNAGGSDIKVTFGDRIGFGGISFNGTLDEVGWWDKYLTPTDIQDLFNSNTGITNPDSPVGIKVNSPVNTTSVAESIDFNCSFVDTEIINVSLIINGIRNITLTNTTASLTNITLNKSLNFPASPDFISWNCEARDVNNNYSTSYMRDFRIGFVENYQTYNKTVTEGSTHNFLINVTYANNSFTNIEAIFNYNNTNYSSQSSGSGNTLVFNRSIAVPSILVSSSFVFNWTIRISNLTTTLEYKSNSTTQTVNPLTIDRCQTNSILLLNYTLRDEETREVINTTFYNSTVGVDLILRVHNSAEVILNLSTNYSAPNSNNSQVCIDADLIGTYDLFVTTIYDGDGYAREFHHIQNSTISNSSLPINIDLHDILDSQDTEFLITFKDKNFLTVENALIDIQRKYVSNGTFRSVEISKTDRNGQSIAHLNTNNILYSILVTKDKNIIGSFDNVAVFCEDSVIGKCEINLNTLSSITNIKNFEEIGNITFSFNFNATLRRITLVFSSIDGTPKTVLLNTTKFDRFGNNTVCFQSLTSSSGTLTCDIANSYGNITLISRLYSNNKFITQRTFKINADSINLFGSSNAGLMALLYVISLGLMFIGSPLIMMLGLIIGIFLIGFLFLTTGTSFAGIGGSVLVLVTAIVIIIYKFARRGSV